MPVNKFKSSARNYTSSNKFIEDYEKLLKKNTGSSLLFAQDTGFNPSYNLTNQQVVAPEVQGGLSSPQMSTNYQAPARREYAPLPEAIPPEAPQEQDPGQLPENPTPEQMLQAIFNAAWEPQLPTTEQLEQRFQQTGEAYPIMSMADGSVQYSDGSVRQMTSDEPPMPIASMADGTVLWSDGFVRERPAEGLAGYMAGVNGLSEFLFNGQDARVTQDYGNINPGMGYGSRGHMGTDFGTYDLANKKLMAPVQMTVKQIISENSGSPYGNSVLLQLPSGEMLRLSHLSQLGQFAEGQVLNAGDLIGIPGSTGNSTAEHLDVEYYNADGQLSDPNGFKANAPQYSIANNIVGTSPYQNQSVSQQSQPQTATAQPVQNEMPAFTSPLFDTVDNGIKAVEQPIKQAVQATGNAAKQAGQVLGTGIEQANLTGDLGLGLSETLKNDPIGARTEQARTIEKAGQAYNIPESGVSEATLKGGLVGATRQLAGNVADTLSTPFKKLGIPDFGISEAIANNPTVNTNVNLAPQSYAYDVNGAPIGSKAPDYGAVLGDNVQNIVSEAKKAGGNLLSTAAKSVDDYADQVTAKAGEGVSTLKQGVQDIAQNIFKKPQVSDIGAKKLIGEDGAQGENLAPGSLLDMNKVGQTQDNRDAFFKYGGADQFKDYLNTGIDKNYKGALNFNLFKDTVFDSPDAIGNIFGNTYLGKEATDKYRTKETAKYPLMSYAPVGYSGLMGYEDGYERGDIDNYNNSVKRAYDDYNNQVRSQYDSYNKSVTDYLGSIPSVFSGANWQIGAPKSARNQFADTALQMKTPEVKVNKSLMSMAPVSSSMNAFSASVSKPTVKSNQLMSVAKPQSSATPQMSMSISKPSMSVAKPQASAPQMSMAPKQSAPLAPMSYAKPMSVAKPSTPAKASTPAKNSSSAKAPYPIMSMANGKVKYSDGSIRSK
jgi:murein DD-endopeptidase MepM/ murein hydrolase activator NlpD